MTSFKRRAAAYLTQMSVGGYSVSGSVAGAANYFLDSYFHKVDERYLESLKNSGTPAPYDLDSHIRELWLGSEIHKCVSLNKTYPSFLKPQTAWAFTKLFTEYTGEGAEYEIVPFLDSYPYKEELKASSDFKIQSEQMQISEVDKVTLPIYGLFFVIRSSDQKRLLVKIDFCYNSSTCSFKVQVPEGSSDLAEGFFTDLANSIAVNDIYRGKCLTFNSGVLGFQSIRPTTWDDIIIKPELRDRIRDNSVGLLNNIENLSSIGMQPCRNTILISPPGMAKTTMFRAISNEIRGGITSIWCTGKSIEYPEHVEALFGAARTLGPCIIFIEDMDLFGAERTNYGGKNYILNEFLAQLDGAQDNSGVAVMASTNDFMSMDEALINRPGRFNDKIIIPLPDAEERSRMFQKFFESYNAKRDRSVTPETWKNMVELTDGFTGDYIREVVNSAVLYAAAEGRCERSYVLINADDLLKAGSRAVENYRIGQKAKKHIQEASDEGPQPG